VRMIRADGLSPPTAARIGPTATPATPFALRAAASLDFPGAAGGLAAVPGAARGAVAAFPLGPTADRPVVAGRLAPARRLADR
jgi:hypothetical protein